MMDASSRSSNLNSVQQHIEEEIQQWYSDQLGHASVKATCHIFSDKLMIVLDEAVTQPERLLVENGRSDFAHQVRTALDGIFRLHLQHIIEALTQVRIIDLLTTTRMDTERSSIVAILSDTVTSEALAENPSGSDVHSGE